MADELGTLPLAEWREEGEVRGGGGWEWEEWEWECDREETDRGGAEVWEGGSWILVASGGDLQGSVERVCND